MRRDRRRHRGAGLGLATEQGPRELPNIGDDGRAHGDRGADDGRADRYYGRASRLHAVGLHSGEFHAVASDLTPRERW